MTETLKIAIAGLGTVGAGTIQLLADQAGILEQRCGRAVVVTAVSARDRNRDRGVDISGFDWFDDPAEMAAQADADVVVELIGGEDGPAPEASSAEPRPLTLLGAGLPQPARMGQTCPHQL